MPSIVGNRQLEAPGLPVPYRRVSWRTGAFRHLCGQAPAAAAGRPRRPAPLL